ncbi:Hypothetical protein mma_0680 [Janthinobacterium sp. Marseille]|nr:hypothetical protein [Janthinobacterium sp. Marseille]ABR91839.1 Hypothetical protein mma_0680 [Janthinobacterium sp. Marseille]
MRLRILFLSLVIFVSACGVIGPKINFYDGDAALKQADAANVRGSRTKMDQQYSPVIVFLDSIDKQATGRAKEARCNFEKPYPITSGVHEFVVVLSAGEVFSTSRFGFTSVSLNVAPGAKVIFYGEIYSTDSAAIWAADETGNLLSKKIPLTLKDSPSKGMPFGFSAIENSCSFP